MGGNHGKPTMRLKQNSILWPSCQCSSMVTAEKWFFLDSWWTDFTEAQLNSAEMIIVEAPMIYVTDRRIYIVYHQISDMNMHSRSWPDWRWNYLTHATKEYNLNITIIDINYRSMVRSRILRQIKHSDKVCTIDFVRCEITVCCCCCYCFNFVW